MLRRLGIVPQRRLEFELADGGVIEQDIGYATVRIDGVAAPTIVVFAEEDAPPLMGAHALESVTMVVDPVRMRLAPTRALLMRAEG